MYVGYCADARGFGEMWTCMADELYEGPAARGTIGGAGEALRPAGRPDEGMAGGGGGGEDGGTEPYWSCVCDCRRPDER